MAPNEQITIRVDDDTEIETKIKEKLIMLKDWRNMAKNYSWLHQQSYRYFQRMNLCFMVPIILLSTASGAINFTQVNEGKCEEGTNVISLVLGVTGLSAAALSTIYNFMRLGERLESHNAAASDFEKLARDISVQTLLSTTEEKTYANLAEFIKDTNDRLNRLVEMSPVIPDIIFKRFERYQAESARKHNVVCRKSVDQPVDQERSPHASSPYMGMEVMRSAKSLIAARLSNLPNRASVDGRHS